MKNKRAGGILAGMLALVLGLVMALGTVGVSAASAQATDSENAVSAQAVETKAEPIAVLVPAPKIGEVPAKLAAASIKGQGQEATKQGQDIAEQNEDAVKEDEVELEQSAEDTKEAEATEGSIAANGATAVTASGAKNPVKITSLDWKDDKGKAFTGKFEVNKRYSVVVGLSTDEAHSFDAKKTRVTIAGNKAELSKVTKTSLVATYRFAKLQDPATATYSVNVTNDGHGDAVANPASGKTGEEVTLVATPKEGYEFDKWEVISAEGSKIEGDKLVIGTDDINVKAAFKKTLLGSQEDGATDTTTPETPINGDDNDSTLYTLVVGVPDGNGSYTVDPVYDNDSYAAGEEITIAATPNIGFVFDEWKVASGELPSSIDLKQPTLKFNMPASNLKIDGYFKEPPAATYTVEVTNDGKGTATANPTSGATGTEVTLTATPNDGYEFAGWEIVSGDIATEDIVNDKFSIASSNVSIKATFKEKGTASGQFSITFDPNGGTGTMEPQYFNSGESATLNENKFTREGYTFGSWNTKADGSGTRVRDKAKVKLSSNVTLYAQWTSGSSGSGSGSGSGSSASTYTISFNGNGGSGSMSSISVNSGESVVLSANQFTRSGYTFTGWNTRSNGTGTAYGDQATVTPNGSMTLYAQWSRGSSSSTSSNSSNSTNSNGSLSNTGDGTTAVPIILGVAALAILVGGRAAKKE